MFSSRVFTAWFVGMALVWAVLFALYCDLSFLAAHVAYPLTMVVGAFVAGVTPQGGGAVAFPVLNLFLEVDRAAARDFSLMIQSVGMTSASVYILTRPGERARDFLPLLWLAPAGVAGFVAGMTFLQWFPLVFVQALFFGFITAFALAYVARTRRGDRTSLAPLSGADRATLGATLFVGGLIASLFGTGADILLYTLLVARLRLEEKHATYCAILVMAGLSVVGFAWRAGVDQAVTLEAVRIWLCAFPVVLVMAPFGAFVLSRIRTEWMLWGVAGLNVIQFSYFHLVTRDIGASLLALAIFAAILALFHQALHPRHAQKARAPETAHTP